MNLTTEQHRAIENGEAVETIVAGIRCVLISKVVYEQMKQTLYNDSPLTNSEMISAMQQIAELAGWNDPEMDVYDENPPTS